MAYCPSSQGRASSLCSQVGGLLRDVFIAGAYTHCVDGDSNTVQSSPKDLPKPFYQQSQLCYFSCTGLLPLIYQKLYPGVALRMGSNTIVAVKPKNMSNIRFIWFLYNLCLEQDKQAQYFRRY